MIRIGLFILFVFSVVFGSATSFAQSAPHAVAYRVTAQQVETVVAQKLAELGAGERIRASVNGTRTSAYYEGTTPVELDAGGITFDKTTERWNGNLLLKQNGAVLKALPIAGRYDETQLLPVLKRQVRSGDVIAQADLDFIDFPISRVRGEVVTDGAQLIGMSPRAVISPNRPVRTLELSTPAVMKKNAVVQMRYSSGNMQLVASGQAMTDGAKGDIIEIRNLSSRQVVRAMVEGPTQVSVKPFVYSTAQASEHFIPSEVAHVTQ